MKTDLKQSLNRAVDQLPHPSFSDIADPPVQKMKTMDRFTAQEERESSGGSSSGFTGMPFRYLYVCCWCCRDSAMSAAICWWTAPLIWM